MSYQSAAIARQQVLDYINAQPVGYNPSGAEIMTATGLTKSEWSSCVKTMTTHRELEKVGKGKAVRYRALVETTISGEELLSKVNTARSIVAKENSPAPRQYVHGVYTNRPDSQDHVRPTHQEGQGSGRRVVYIGSALA